jgi:hypothetical protein
MRPLIHFPNITVVQVFFECFSFVTSGGEVVEIICMIYLYYKGLTILICEYFCNISMED